MSGFGKISVEEFGKLLRKGWSAFLGVLAGEGFAQEPILMGNMNAWMSAGLTVIPDGF